MASSNRAAHRFVKLLPDLLLVAAAFLLRIHNLTTLPVFVDEVFHIEWAQAVWTGHPFGGEADGRLLNIWLISLIYPFNATLWASRFTVALGGTVSVAAALALGRKLFSVRAGRAAAVLVMALPYTFFFDRLALADPLAAHSGLLVVWLCSLNKPWRDPKFAVLAGMALTAASLSKIPMLVYFALPALGWWFSGEKPRRYPPLLAAYGTAFALTGGVLLVGPDAYGVTGSAHTNLADGGQAAALVVQVVDNVLSAIPDSARMLADYVGWPVVGLVVGGILHAVISKPKTGWLLAAGALLPIVLHWLVVSRYFPRFFLPGFAVGVVLAAGLLDAGVAWLAARFERLPDNLTLYGVTLLLLLPVALPFIPTAYTQPADLPLPTEDRRDYIEGAPSGFGFDVAAGYLRQQAAATDGRLLVICEAQSTCDTLEVYLIDAVIIEFYVESDAPDNLLDLLAEEHTILLAQENPHPSANADGINPAGLGLEAEQIEYFTRPGGAGGVEIWTTQARNQ